MPLAVAWPSQRRRRRRPTMMTYSSARLAVPAAHEAMGAAAGSRALGLVAALRSTSSRMTEGGNLTNRATRASSGASSGSCRRCGSPLPVRCVSQATGGQPGSTHRSRTRWLSWLGGRGRIARRYRRDLPSRRRWRSSVLRWLRGLRALSGSFGRRVACEDGLLLRLLARKRRPGWCLLLLDRGRRHRLRLLRVMMLGVSLRWVHRHAVRRSVDGVARIRVAVHLRVVLVIGTPVRVHDGYGHWPAGLTALRAGHAVAATVEGLGRRRTELERCRRSTASTTR
jgi:hypothetical protein